ncbi:MAG: hypothetical protein TREMPRED_004096 [Tremellales sp. Tagirdzhanova-0007]|nr:MAG: hypothetical protein TREMPRED_004096 [Tremellales sp. Tagirdzhanova-0007]
MTSNAATFSAVGLPTSIREPPKMKKHLSTPRLRKAKSSSSIGSPGNNPEVGRTYQVEGDQFIIVSSPNLGFTSSPQPQLSLSTQPRLPANRPSAGPSRPMSMGLFGPSSSSGSIPSVGRASGKGLGINMTEQPEAFTHWLRSYKGTDLLMEVGRCRKLRMLLRHESTAWVGKFLEIGGYKLILARLQDVLDVEWREEQHDDQMLYELLRCVKALSTSEVGKSALRAHFPSPFPALSKLLFSEKKPGDLPLRQIIVELWIFLFDLFPSPSNYSSRSNGVSIACNPVDITSTVQQLLIPDPPPSTKDHHDFITVAHRPRIFKAWIGELGEVCRDYFWVTCHHSNNLWALDEVDESLVEKPVAPGGATGGVEFEAMNYVTTQFKLINMLCKQQALLDQPKATQLHDDLRSSGMDSILVTLRKASMTYYPALHLELARYVSLLRAASPNARLPHLIDKLVGSPPEELKKIRSDEGWLPMPVPRDGGRRGGWDM